PAKPKPAFEVASIKPVGPFQLRPGIRISGNRFDCLSITHKLLARSGETVGKANTPPWQRRGECAQFKKSCEATFVGRRRGGSLNDRLSVVEPTTPVAPSLR